MAVLSQVPLLRSRVERRLRWSPSDRAPPWRLYYPQRGFLPSLPAVCFRQKRPQ